MLKAAIVGCGRIAGFLDNPNDPSIVTHAHAYTAHPNIKLTACYDPDPQALDDFQKKWGTPSTYHNLDQLLKREKIDILSICSPTIFHFDAMQKALDNPHISTIICEKPFIQTQNELNRLLPSLKQTNKKVIINFIRRFDPSINRAVQMLKNGVLGELQYFHGSFTKGLYHNGSHMLELIEHLCGNILSLHAMNLTTIDEDYFGSFYLETDKVNGNIQNTDGMHYALFELEVICSKGRIRIIDSGHTIYVDTPVPSKKYAGYFNLQQTEAFNDTATKNLLHTVEFALQYENGKQILEQHIRLSQKLLDIKDKLKQKHTLYWS